MAPDETPWSTALDDRLRSLLLAGTAEHPALADPRDVRRRGEAVRRRRWAVRTTAAAAAVIVLGGVGFALAGRAEDRSAPPSLPASAPVTSTASDAARSLSTDVIGDDGALGPFRVGMDRATVREAIASAGLEGSVRIASRELGGGIVDRVLLQPGADTGVGDGDVIGTFDRETDRLSTLVAPATARIHGLGVGSPVGAFEEAFPGRVHPDEASSVYLLDLEGGVRLQLGRPSSFLDPSAVAAVVVLPPMAPTFPYFD